MPHMLMLQVTQEGECETMTERQYELIKFEELKPQERKLLLSALDIDLRKMRCCYCGEKVSYKVCGIMPPLKRGEKGKITCDSPICILEYLQDLRKA